MATKHHRAKSKARKKPKVIQHLCEECGKPIRPYEEGYTKCAYCFFKSRKCSECGKQINPYVRGYTKCRECYLKEYRNQQAQLWPRQPIVEQPQYKPYKSNLKSKLETLLYKVSLPKIFLVLLLIGIFSPFVLLGHPNMQPMSIGNPRPVYFYDIDSSCITKYQTVDYSPAIVDDLAYLSSQTGLKFVRLPHPYALLIGGISYTCEGMLSNPGAYAESESGMIGTGFIIVAWNVVKIPQPNQEVILHETLHSMGFDHSQNPSSIMYPYGHGSSQIDPDIISFIKSTYVNPLAYLNLIPINLLWVLIFLSAFISDKLFDWIRRL